MVYADEELNRLTKQKSNLEHNIVAGGTRAEKQRDLTQPELSSGKVNLGDGKTRPPTKEETKQKKYLVSKVFDDPRAKLWELEDLKQQIDERKEAIAANRQKDVLHKVGSEAKGVKDHVTTSASGTERVVMAQVTDVAEVILREMSSGFRALQEQLPEPTVKAQRQKMIDDETAILIASDPLAKKAFEEEWARKAEIAYARKACAESKKEQKSAEKRKDQAALAEWNSKRCEANLWLQTLQASERFRKGHENAKQTWIESASKEHEKDMVESEMRWHEHEKAILEHQKKPTDAIKARLEGLVARAKQIEVDMTEQKKLEQELEEKEKRGAELRRMLGRDPLPAIADGPESSRKGKKRGGADKEAKAGKRAKRG